MDLFSVKAEGLTWTSIKDPRVACKKGRLCACSSGCNTVSYILTPFLYQFNVAVRKISCFKKQSFFFFLMYSLMKHFKSLD